MTNILLLLVSALLLWSIALSYLYFSSIRFYKRLKGDEAGFSLHEFLNGIVTKQIVLEGKIKKLEEAHSALSDMNLKNVCRVGFVRFNPFDDAGSNQSFSLALLDRNNDGVVVTSLHGRSGTRIYSKPVKNRIQENFELSKEEKDAIDFAIKSNL